MRDLADAREFALAHIGHAARREHLDQRRCGLACRFGTGDDGGKLAGLDDLGVAADRRGDEVGAELLELLADRRGFLHRDGRAIDHDRRHPAALAAHAVLAVQHLLHALAGIEDREQHVDVLEFEQVIDHLAADLLQRLGLGARTVPDGDVVAGLDQPLGHGKAHAARADPADLLRILRRHGKLPCCRRFLSQRTDTATSCRDADDIRKSAGLVHERAPALSSMGCGDRFARVCRSSIYL